MGWLPHPRQRMQEALSGAQPPFAMPAADVDRHAAFDGPPGHVARHWKRRLQLPTGPVQDRLTPGTLFFCYAILGCRLGGRVGELQWIARLYTNLSLKFAAPQPRSPKPSKGSHRLRPNWPSSPHLPNPLSRFGRLLQSAATQDGCQPAEQSCRPSVRPLAGKSGASI